MVLYNESLNLIKGEPEDMLAEHGVIRCAKAVEEALAPIYRVARVPIHADVEVALAPYTPLEWTVFNLGEGIEGRLFEEARIIWAIEAMGFSFTGSSGETTARSIHKALAKQCLVRAGLSTPRWWLYRDPVEVQGELTFPLIVKPVAEDGSLGVVNEAVVLDEECLRQRVGYIVERYRQAALVEEFIVGREFNIAIWGDPPQVLPLAEIDFGDFKNPYERIVSFAAKWQEDSFAYNHSPTICPAQVTQELGQRLVDAALGAWTALGCRGYARVDMRVDETETPYIIEVNCNPDISPDAGFFRAAKTAGYNYQDMVVKILKLAQR